MRASHMKFFGVCAYLLSHRTFDLFTSLSSFQISQKPGNEDMNIQELRRTMMLAKKTDPEKSTVLAMLLDATQKLAKADGNRAPEEKDLLAAAKRELKMANQSLEAGIDVGNTITILEVFLPKTKSAEETKTIVEALIATLPEKNPKLMGKVMGNLKQEYGEELDMGIASQMVKEALS